MQLDTFFIAPENFDWKKNPTIEGSGDERFFKSRTSVSLEYLQKLLDQACVDNIAFLKRFFSADRENRVTNGWERVQSLITSGKFHSHVNTLFATKQAQGYKGVWAGTPYQVRWEAVHRLGWKEEPKMLEWKKPETVLLQAEVQSSSQNSLSPRP